MSLKICLKCSLPALLLASSAALAQSQYQAVDLSYAGNYGTAANGVSAARSVGYERYDFYYIRHVIHYKLHAVYWPNAGSPPVALNPFNSPYSVATASSGNRQAGTVSVKVGGTFQGHAVVWQGTAASAKDINMAGYDDSSASGISGKEVVGQAQGTATGGYPHAVVWNLNGPTIADLNGQGHQDSGALATDGKQQVGWETDANGADIHAMLWQGTAASAVDLHPSTDGFFTSTAYGVDGGKQIGIGETLDSAHALLWKGTAESAIDLNPKGFVDSYGTAISGNKEVGFATKADFKYHAIVWSGKASKYVDLQAFLPQGFDQSYATGIDSAGNVVGWATDSAGVYHAMLWQPMP